MCSNFHCSGFESYKMYVVSYQLVRLDYLVRLGTVARRIAVTGGFQAFFPPQKYSLTLCVRAV